MNENELIIHELRIRYLDVLMSNGVDLEKADLFFESMLQRDLDKEVAQREALQHALELTAIEAGKNKSIKSEDFSLEEQITAKAFVAGEKLKRQLEADKKKMEDEKSNNFKEFVDLSLARFPDSEVSPQTNWKSTVDNSKTVDTSKITQSISIMEDVDKEPPQQSGDAVNYLKPKMVEPNKKSEDRVSDQIKESVYDKKDLSNQNVPLRYEDRMKLSQQGKPNV